MPNCNTPWARGALKGTTAAGVPPTAQASTPAPDRRQGTRRGQQRSSGAGYRARTCLRSHRASSPVRAALWLLGRPWGGGAQAGWPTRWLVQSPPARAAAPDKCGRLSSTRRYVASLASALFWHVRIQLTILRQETRARLRGRRGRGRLRPCSSRRKPALPASEVEVDYFADHRGN